MNTSQELHRKAFELTLALYRVTDFFPQGEVLKWQLREKANEIFGNVTEYDYASGREPEALIVLARVETIKGYLRVSQAMRLVRPINLTILEREYEVLEHFFRQEIAGNEISQNRDWNPDEISYKHETKQNSPEMSMRNSRIDPDGPAKDSREQVSQKPPHRPSGQDASITGRQKDILGFVEKMSHVKISDFQTLLVDVSAKTIQRDLHDLVQKDFLKKEN